MYAQIRKKPEEADVSSAPLNSEAEGQPVSDSAPMSQVVAKLAQLRERYLSELQAARDRAKKNFLR